MVEVKDIAGLARYAAAHGIGELVVEERGRRIGLRLLPPAPTPSPVAASPPAPPRAVAVASPAMGVFQAAPDAPAAGTAVTGGAILGHVRLGPLLLAVRAPIDGILLGAGIPDGTLVGHGDRLLEIEPQVEKAT
ncbi:hypothetical protein M0638_25830 [Roseomonas sp. NAR14]|uniref:Acetyl-CoA carboxylase biotin carboxyl carrier protein subunit n=1 Tax=Roseomonas acroporae TaxID=2937791 RepID=A0A9X2BXY3_9PROT|nr:hypothetical protein [Roseomonas acroporae]MCK8787781.1 hypothetical protein [Roseomonas acroporae]